MMNPLNGLLQAQQAANQYRTDGKRLKLEQQLAQARVGDIEQGWRQHPGRAPGGTGTTGLHPADKFGWSDMLNEQTEHLGLQNALAGEAQPTIRVNEGAGLRGLRKALPSPVTKAAPQPMPESHDMFMRKWGR